MKALLNKNKKFYVLLVVIASVIFAASMGMLAVSSRLSQVSKAMPGGGNFDISELPEGFDASGMPEGFDASELPEDFDASNMKMPGGEMPDMQNSDGTDSIDGTDTNGNSGRRGDKPEAIPDQQSSDNTDTIGNAGQGDNRQKELPEDFDASNMPEGFDTSNMPEGLDSSELPEGFDTSNLPENFDASNVPDGKAGFLASNTFRIIMIALAIVSAVVDAFGIIMLIKNGKKNNAPKLPGSVSCSGDDETCCESKRENPGASVVNDAVISDSAEELPLATTVDPVADRLKKRKKTRIRLAVLLVLIVIIVIVVQILSKKSENTQSIVVNERVIEGIVSEGNLSRTLKSSGIVASAAETDISVPGNIEVTAYFVSDGDVVEEGDIIASVDKNSVIGAIADVEELIADVDSEMMSVKDDSISSEITSPYDVKVVKIYAGEGQDVVDVMYQNGSLMLLSLDGSMAIDIDNAGGYKVGDTLTVIDSEGNSHEGSVAEVKKKKLTVTVDMTECDFGESVKITSSDGTTLGEGTLYVYSELKVTGFSGTVSEIEVSEGDEVDSNDTLMTLANTDYTAEYQSLLEKRILLVDQYNELIQIAGTGFVTAQSAGTISGVDASLLAGTITEEEAYLMAGTDSSQTQSVAGLSYASAEEKDKSSTCVSTKSSSGNVSLMMSSFKEGVKKLLATATTETLEEKNPSGQGPGESNPGGENPGGNNHGGENPGGNNPGGENPGGENPGGNNPGGENPGGENPGEQKEEDSPELIAARENIDETARAEYMDKGTTSRTVEILWLDSKGSIKTTGLPAEVIVELKVRDKVIDVQSVKTNNEGSWIYTWNNLSDTGEYSINVTENTLEGYTITNRQIGSVNLLINTEKAVDSGNQDKPGADNNNGNQSNTPSNDNNGYISGNGGIVSGDGSYGFTSTAVDLTVLATEALAAEEENSTFTLGETVLCQLTPNDKVNIDITIDELDVGKVIVGQKCVITLDAISGQSFDGIITRKDPTGSNDGGNSKYTVTVTLDKTENMLLGMNASVSIELETIEGILVIPEEALVEQEGSVYVYTAYDEKQDELSELIQVETGLSDGSNVEITGGLENADTYYYRYGGSIEYTF